MSIACRCLNTSTAAARARGGYEDGVGRMASTASETFGAEIASSVRSVRDSEEKVTHEPRRRTRTVSGPTVHGAGYDTTGKL